MNTSEVKNIGYVDISNLVHRTINGYFNALPEIKKARISKQNVNEIKEKIVLEQEGQIEKLLLHMVINGFFNFQKVLNIKEENMIAVFDSKSWRKQVVNDFYNDNEDIEEQIYKSGRENNPYINLIHNTISKTEDLLKELNFNVLKEDNLEADDLIALSIKQHQIDEEETNSIIISNDIDFYQLQQIEGVKQYNPIKKEIINLEPIEAYKELLLKLITGDNSDNIPSIYKLNFDNLSLPQLGPKTIMKIFDKYNITLDMDFDEISEKLISEIAFRIFIKQFEIKKDKMDMVEKNSEEYSNFKKSNKTFKDLKKIIDNEAYNDTIYERALDIINMTLLKYIQYSFDDIRKSINKQFLHNNNIINFEQIPTIFQDLNIELNNKPLQNVERKHIFLSSKYELNKLADTIKIIENNDINGSINNDVTLTISYNKTKTFVMIGGIPENKEIQEIEGLRFFLELDNDNSKNLVLKIHTIHSSEEEIINFNKKILDFYIKNYYTKLQKEKNKNVLKQAPIQSY